MPRTLTLVERLFPEVTKVISKMTGEPIAAIPAPSLDLIVPYYRFPRPPYKEAKSVEEMFRNTAGKLAIELGLAQNTITCGFDSEDNEFVRISMKVTAAQNLDIMRRYVDLKKSAEQSRKL